MNHIFEPRGYFTVPDGTELSAFLNATDVTQQDVPWRALGEMSVASGRIGPKVHSWVHVLPVVAQVTYVTAGRLTIRMRDSSAAKPYDLPMRAGQACLTQPGTLFQLRNESDEVAEVLYIVSPSYVFELDGKHVRHDDAVLVTRTWEELSASNSHVLPVTAGEYEARARRVEALARLAERKGKAPKPLAMEAVRSLKSKCDYLAPDGSEIRLLVDGDGGGFAHCVLPAGRTSSAVRHRTVEELWYVIEGVGEIWRGRDGEAPRIDPLRAGDSVRIPTGTSFQFRAARDSDLKLLLATMPPWPGAQEAVATLGGFGG